MTTSAPPASSSVPSPSPPPLPSPPSKEQEALSVLEDNLVLISKGITTRDEVLFRRALRRSGIVRAQISMRDMESIVKRVIPLESPSMQFIASAFEILRGSGGDDSRSAMDVVVPIVAAAEEDISTPGSSSRKRKTIPSTSTATSSSSSGAGVNNASLANANYGYSPEAEIYLHMIVCALLLKQKKSIFVAHPDEQQQQKQIICLQNVDTMIQRATSGEASSSSSSVSGRMINVFLARAYQYWARVYELAGKFEEARKVLLAAHRTACLRLNEIGQATLINLILRNYLACNMVEQAVKFSSRASFPSNASNNQQVRYLYYQGRSLAIQLEYSEAFSSLQQAIRKAPQLRTTGFRLTLYKLTTVVQLLMGESPDRAWFSDKDLQVNLKPYFELVNAVRTGKVSAFEKVCVLVSFRYLFFSLFSKNPGRCIFNTLSNSTRMKICASCYDFEAQ
jgi:hypothetical protein